MLYPHINNNKELIILKYENDKNKINKSCYLNLQTNYFCQFLVLCELFQFFFLLWLKPPHVWCTINSSLLERNPSAAKCTAELKRGERTPLFLLQLNLLLIGQRLSFWAETESLGFENIYVMTFLKNCCPTWLAKHTKYSSTSQTNT